MTTSNSTNSATIRKIIWSAVVVLAVSVAACGGTSQSLGTAPSAFSAVAAAQEAREDGGSFSALKEGNGKGKGPDAGKGPDSGKGPDKGIETPTTGTTPTTGETPDVDGGDEGEDSGHGHGRAAMQIEGFTTSITGTCPDLTIEINGLTVLTDLNTSFQRAACEDLAPAAVTPPPTGTTPAIGTTPTTGTTPTSGTTAETTTDATTTPEAMSAFRLHIAAKMDATGNLVATYVRMQGPKIAGGDDDDDDDTVTPPTTGTTPTTGTAWMK